MAKMFDRLLLFIYSFIVGIALILLLFMTFGWIDYDHAENYLNNLYREAAVAYPFIVCGILLLLVSVRLFYLSIRRSTDRQPSIDRSTDFGKVRISFDTVKSLALKAAGKIKGLSDIKARIRIAPAGMEIDVRAAVNGDTSIPQLTEEAQRAIKYHVEELAGVPVASVSVYVSNVAETAAPLFKSRVE